MMQAERPALFLYSVVPATAGGAIQLGFMCKQDISKGKGETMHTHLMIVYHKLWENKRGFFIFFKINLRYATSSP